MFEPSKEVFIVDRRKVCAYLTRLFKCTVKFTEWHGGLAVEIKYKPTTGRLLGNLTFFRECVQNLLTSFSLNSIETSLPEQVKLFDEASYEKKAIYNDTIAAIYYAMVFKLPVKFIIYGK